MTSPASPWSAPGYWTDGELLAGIRAATAEGDDARRAELQDELDGRRKARKGTGTAPGRAGGYRGAGKALGEA